jgi:hypothetical protein
MAEPWEEALEREAQSNREREDQQRKEDQSREEQHEREARQREADERKREEEKEKRREAEERQREEAQQKREQAREAREKGEAEARDKVAPSPVSGYSSGGSQSFFLQVPPESFPIVATGNQNVNFKGNSVQGKTVPLNTSLLGNRSIAPGSEWAVFGGYLRYPFTVVMAASNKVEPISTFKGLVGTVQLVASVNRGPVPIWLNSVTNSLTFVNYGPLAGGKLVYAQTMITLGVEFNSPVKLGAGEQLFIEMSLEAKVAWAEVAEPLAENEISMYSQYEQTPQFAQPPASGAFRYLPEQEGT